jgi:hypothetical protein
MVRNISVDSSSDHATPQPQPKVPAPAQPPSYTLEPNVEVWVKEQMFEEDVAAFRLEGIPHRWSPFSRYRQLG